MANALTPREIQQRIRRGASPEEVALAAGVPMDQIIGFVKPALAERDYYTRQAMAGPVRRRGQSIAHRTLESAVTERLASRSIDLERLTWDAWQAERGKWLVTAAFHVGEQRRIAEFTYQQAGRFSVAANHEARWLLGESAPGEPLPHAEGEPTVTLTPVLDEEPLEPTVAVSAADLSEATDAFSEAVLTEVDGIYDLQTKDPDADVLKEILSTVSEDSVKIYTGLIQAALAAESAKTEAPTTRPTKPPAPAAKAPTAVQAAQPQLEDPPVVEDPPQPSLIDAPARPPRRKRRAAVPSWDEIMFGGSK